MKKLTFLLTIGIGYTSSLIAQNNMANLQAQLPKDLSGLKGHKPTAHLPHKVITSYVPLYDSIYNWNWDTNTTVFDIYNYKVIDIVYDAHNNLISEVYQAWIGGAWVDSAKDIYSYNSNNLVTNLTEQIWNGNVWMNNYQSNFTYNSNNLEILEIEQTWNGGWVNSVQSTFTYNVNELETTEVQQTWNLGSWVNSDSIYYTYNSNNLETSWVEYDWWSGGAWENWYQESFAFNSNNLDTCQIYQNWGGNAWANLRKFLFTYNSNNLVTSDLYQIWNDTVWINDIKWIYTYNSNSMETSDLFQPLSIYAWPNEYLYNWTYDSNNLMLSETFKNFDSTSTTVTSGDSTYYYFHKTVQGINEITKSGNLTVYPNPSSGKFAIQAKSEELRGKSIEVYNVFGQLVKTQCIASLQPPSVLAHCRDAKFCVSTIDLSSQPDGVYFYRVVGEDGGLIGEGKVVIEK